MSITRSIGQLFRRTCKTVAQSRRAAVNALASQFKELDKNSPTPLYFQLYSLLKGLILDGTLSFGTRMPTEEVLATLFSVSRITAKRAMDDLAGEALLERRRGKGTHVTYRYSPRPVKAPLVGMLQEIETMARNSRARVIRCSLQEPPQAIRDELSALLPDGAEEFAANASRYIAEIEAADADVQALLVGLAPEHRVLVTFHDAFGYFARRYDLEVFGFVIEGPEQEASAAELADLIEAMRDRGVTRVYREPQFESSTIDRIADETGAEVRVIYSQPIGEVESYTDLLRANGRALAE